MFWVEVGAVLLSLWILKKLVDRWTTLVSQPKKHIPSAAARRREYAQEIAKSHNRLLQRSNRKGKYILSQILRDAGKGKDVTGLIGKRIQQRDKGNAIIKSWRRDVNNILHPQPGSKTFGVRRDGHERGRKI